METTAYSVYREILIWDNKKRRNEIIKKQKLALAKALAIISTLTIVTVSSVFIGMTITPEARSESPRLKYYTTHTVAPSETLQEISEQYISEEYVNIDAYIDEVCNINHIYDASDILTGDQIIVPYYSAEFKQ